ncbi:hypothetical protein H2O64_16275 [Kordia sp. YSTF-M3]|uniref:Uncharacterized protein n=1 Tax=Kordia aestuariivivens TaxID=2759037 RepID=A0ABR7QCF9_9FLAO|nr:hypothetical protein [Kordia aestuariivivens]MBC8756234.1 hypothetical protein [Kordia aestuariivivens]
MASTANIISEIAQFSIVLPITACVFRYKRFDKLFWTLGILLAFAGIISYSAYQLYIKGENNMHLLHVYTVVEYTLWSLFYYQLFQKVWVKRLLISLNILFILFSIYNVLNWQPLDTYNSYGRSLEGILLLCFAIGWFYKVFINSAIKRLETHPIFWINAGVLVYFSGAFLLFSSKNFMQKISREEFIAIWTLHGIFLIIHYLFISIGIWLKKR